jgi:SulP family sulfate permease
MTATSQSTRTEPRGISRYIPILQWAPQYKRRWLRLDLIAGLTVGALVVPKSLGYAGIAGVPIQHGLYAAAAGAILYAFFGTSRQIATGPSSALAAVAAGAVISAGVGGSEEAVTLVAAITFVTGILFLLLALFRMGWISQFLSKAVITGFLFGAAIQVVIGELPKITGTSIEGSNSWQKLFSWLQSVPETDLATLVVGVISLVLIFGLRFAVPKIPGALVLVIGGLLASAILGLGDLGVALVGEVPSGLPSLALPDLQFIIDNLAVIGAAAVGLLLIGFSQSAGDARAFASKHKYRGGAGHPCLHQSVGQFAQ